MCRLFWQMGSAPSLIDVHGEFQAFVVSRHGQHSRPIINGLAQIHVKSFDIKFADFHLEEVQYVIDQ